MGNYLAQDMLIATSPFGMAQSLFNRSQNRIIAD
jgi:hypothetical protein